MKDTIEELQARIEELEMLDDVYFEDGNWLVSVSYGEKVIELELPLTFEELTEEIQTFTGKPKDEVRMTFENSRGVKVDIFSELTFETAVYSETEDGILFLTVE
jgi:hypothetical protein